MRTRRNGYTIRALLLVVMIVSAFAATTATAQDASAVTNDKGYRISAISWGSGENPIASGITASLRLENEKKRFAEITVQHEQGWVMYGKNFKMGKVDTSIAMTGGHFQGAPYVGPYIFLSLPLQDNPGMTKVSISLLEWPAFFAGEPRDWQTKNDGVANPEMVLIGQFAMVQFNVGRFGVNLAHQDFMDNPLNTVPGVVYNHNVRDDLKVNVSASLNMNKNKMMYFIGATKTFAVK